MWQENFVVASISNLITKNSEFEYIESYQKFCSIELSILNFFELSNIQKISYSGARPK